jgi:FkbM family methyltransferase
MIDGQARTIRSSHSAAIMSDPEPLNRLKQCRHGQMLFNPRDQYIGRALDLYGEFSEGEIDVFRRMVQVGSVVIEVGANIGSHTVFLSRQVGPTGKVMAFEPQRIVFQTLCANLALNDLTNVFASPRAVAEQPGFIVVPEMDYRTENNFGGLSLGDHKRGDRVEVVTIDGLELPRCDLIKIDVEGMEQQVLQGAQQTIARLKPMLYVENDRPKKSAALIRLLDSLGYKMFWHLSPMFNRQNYFGNTENVFGHILSRNMLCIHGDRPCNLHDLRQVEVPDQSLKPELFQTHFNLGNAHRVQGKLDWAAAEYTRALALKPDFAEAHNNLGDILRKQRKFDQARASLGRALAINPHFSDAHNNLGNALKDQGKLDEAAIQYKRALALKPDFVEAHNNLGNILRKQGRLDQARARYEQALVLRPEYAEAHNNLGNLLKDQGKLDEAAAQYEQAVTLKFDLFKAHNNLGNILREQGKLDQALARFEHVLVLKPDYAEAHYSLGNILWEQGKLDQAMARYEQSLALKPDYAEAHYNLGNLLKDQRKLDEAVIHYERALVIKPDLAGAHNNLGTVLKNQGKFDEARARFEQALALKPDYAEAHNNLGNILREQGQLDQAAACYGQALAFKPDHAEAHYNRIELKTFRAGDTDLAVLESLTADPHRLPPRKMLYIHFALGKALEDVGDYRRAFGHWLQGNALKRREIDYNEAAHQQSFGLIADLFDSTLLDRWKGLGDPSPLPIFIVGMPRSGSTLVEQILASHPQIHAAGELKNLDRVVRAVSDADSGPVPVPSCVRAPDAEGLRRLGQAYLASLPTLSDDKIRITDKMPRNFFRIGLIRLILPNARIIHTMRDPVDTCVSCFSKSFSRGQPFSYDLAELGRYYRGYHALMAHWRSVLPAGAMLDVSYENVVDNLEEQARRLIDYCGLPWDDRCLSFHETDRPVRTASNVQVRRPLYSSSVARWRRYEPYLQPLLAELASCREPE